MKIFGALLIGAVLLVATTVSAQYYQYKGEDGQIHFTDNYALIPEDQRAAIKMLDKEEPPSSDVIPQAVAEKAPGAESVTSTDSADNLAPGDLTALKESVEKNNKEVQKMYADLKAAKAALDEEAKTVRNNAQTLEHNEKIKAYNEDAKRYQEKSKALNADITRYNAFLAGKSTKDASAKEGEEAQTD